MSRVPWKNTSDVVSFLVTTVGIDFPQANKAATKLFDNGYNSSFMLSRAQYRNLRELTNMGVADQILFWINNNPASITPTRTPKRLKAPPTTTSSTANMISMASSSTANMISNSPSSSSSSLPLSIHRRVSSRRSNLHGAQSNHIINNMNYQSKKRRYWNTGGENRRQPTTTHKIRVSNDHLLKGREWQSFSEDELLFLAFEIGQQLKNGSRAINDVAGVTEEKNKQRQGTNIFVAKMGMPDKGYRYFRLCSNTKFRGEAIFHRFKAEQARAESVLNHQDPPAEYYSQIKNHYQDISWKKKFQSMDDTYTTTATTTNLTAIGRDDATNNTAIGPIGRDGATNEPAIGRDGARNEPTIGRDGATNKAIGRDGATKKTAILLHSDDDLSDDDDNDNDTDDDDDDDDADNLLEGGFFGRDLLKVSGSKGNWDNMVIHVLVTNNDGKGNLKIKGEVTEQHWSKIDPVAKQVSVSQPDGSNVENIKFEFSQTEKLTLRNHKQNFGRYTKKFFGNTPLENNQYISTMHKVIKYKLSGVYDIAREGKKDRGEIDLVMGKIMELFNSVQNATKFFDDNDLATVQVLFQELEDKIKPDAKSFLFLNHVDEEVVGLVNKVNCFHMINDTGPFLYLLKMCINGDYGDARKWLENVEFSHTMTNDDKCQPLYSNNE